MSQNEILEIYTDGAARGNPGPGGYGIVLKWKNTRKELSGGYRHTTNNRMEMMAVIVALESLTRDGLHIRLYSDSKYLIDSIVKKWVYSWVKKGFANKKNKDLWLRLLPLIQKHRIEWIWVKGHAANVENNRCDTLATSAADGNTLATDIWYEQHIEQEKNLDENLFNKHS